MKVVSHRGGDHLPSDATPEAGTGEGALIRRYRTRPRPRKSEWKLTDALSALDEFPIERVEFSRRPHVGPGEDYEAMSHGLFIVGPICDEIGAGPPEHRAAGLRSASPANGGRPVLRLTLGHVNLRFVSAHAKAHALKSGRILREVRGRSAAQKVL